MNIQALCAQCKLTNDTFANIYRKTVVYFSNRDNLKYTYLPLFYKILSKTYKIVQLVTNYTSYTAVISWNYLHYSLRYQHHVDKALPAPEHKRQYPTPCSNQQVYNQQLSCTHWHKYTQHFETNNKVRHANTIWPSLRSNINICRWVIFSNFTLHRNKKTQQHHRNCAAVWIIWKFC